VVTKTAAPVGGGIHNPTWRDRLFHWNRARRRKKRQAPAHQSNVSSIPQRRPARRPQGHTSRRRRPRRGKLAAVLTLGVGAIAVAVSVAEFATWEAAAELFTLAEAISLSAAYCFGEPSDRAKLKKAQRAGQPPKPPRQPSQPQKSAGHRCGTPTQGGRGKPCERPVKSASDHCWEHPGGRSIAHAPQSMGPRKTRAKGVAPAP
jgi:hypothetical protein